MTNRYTKSWQETYLRPDSPRGPSKQNTEIQLEFLRNHLPQPEFTKVLDVCCGLGRHSIPLATWGHEVLGFDRDPEVIRRAAAAGSPARFLATDMRSIATLGETFDGVICMWQSFGYFDAATNEEVMRSMAGALRPGGRIILDIYNKDFFTSGERKGYKEHHTGEVLDERERLWFEDPDRLHVVIEWTNGESDHFSWQLYSPEELEEMAAGCGLRPMLVCTEFDPGQVAGESHKSFQAVFEKSA